jgi:hypothetical protein
MRRRGAIAWVVLMLAGAAWHPAHAADEIAFGITSKTAFSLAHYVATEKKVRGRSATGAAVLDEFRQVWDIEVVAHLEP